MHSNIASTQIWIKMLAKQKSREKIGKPVYSFNRSESFIFFHSAHHFYKRIELEAARSNADREDDRAQQRMIHIWPRMIWLYRSVTNP